MSATARRPLGPFAFACVAAGVVVTILTNTIWATGLGVALMFVGAASAFVLATTMPDTEQADDISA